MEKLSLPSAGDVVSAITALATISFLLSVAYEYGFAAGLGVEVYAIPMTLADFTQGALFWLPPTAFGMLLGIAPFLIAQPALASTMNSARADANKSAALKSLSRLLLLLTGLLIALMALFYLLAGDVVWMGVAAFLSAAWGAYWLRSPRNELLYFGKVLVGLVPIGVVLGGGSGFLGAVTVSTWPKTQVVLQNDTTRPMVRLYDRGVLYLEGNEARFVQWDLVSRIETRARLRRLRVGYLCQLVGCAEPESQPAPQHDR